jgi:hypothetical protein
VFSTWSVPKCCNQGIRLELSQFSSGVCEERTRAGGKGVTIVGAEIQGLLHPAQANLGYFLAWFQSLQLTSTQSESPLALIPLAPKSHVSLNKYSTANRFFHISNRINCNQAIKTYGRVEWSTIIDLGTSWR